jgi:hypothetical protein
MHFLFRLIAAAIMLIAVARGTLELLTFFRGAEHYDPYVSVPDREGKGAHHIRGSELDYAPEAKNLSSEEMQRLQTDARIARLRLLTQSLGGFGWDFAAGAILFVLVRISRVQEAENL